jgi:signal transduction histidine kinase
MPSPPTDPRWSEVLSLTGHELRNPLGVVVGYIRMALTERAGPLAPFQRRVLEESLKSCSRLSELAGQLSVFSDIEDGTAQFQRVHMEFGGVLRKAIQDLPEMPDRNVGVELEADPVDVSVSGDADRLKGALVAVISAVRREVVSSDRMIVRQQLSDRDGSQAIWVAIGPPERIDKLTNPGTDGLTTFDEWRGGVGLSLPIARRVINAHRGTVWSPVEDSRAGAVLSLPVAD